MGVAAQLGRMDARNRGTLTDGAPTNVRRNDRTMLAAAQKERWEVVSRSTGGRMVLRRVGAGLGGCAAAGGGDCEAPARHVPLAARDDTEAADLCGSANKNKKRSSYDSAVALPPNKRHRAHDASPLAEVTNASDDDTEPVADAALEKPEARLARWACALELQYAVQCVGLAAAILTQYHLAKNEADSNKEPAVEPAREAAPGTPVPATPTRGALADDCSPAGSRIATPAKRRIKAASRFSAAPRAAPRRVLTEGVGDAVVAACLWLAAKVEEVQCEVPSAHELSRVTGVARADLLSTELAVGSALHWNLLKHWHL